MFDEVPMCTREPSRYMTNNVPTFHHTDSVLVMAIAILTFYHKLLTDYRTLNTQYFYRHDVLERHSPCNILPSLATCHTQRWPPCGVLISRGKMAPPSMFKALLLSAYLLLSVCFLLSAYFLAIHCHKRMCLTTSIYGRFFV